MSTRILVEIHADRFFFIVQPTLKLLIHVKLNLIFLDDRSVRWVPNDIKVPVIDFNNGLQLHIDTTRNNKDSDILLQM